MNVGKNIVNLEEMIDQLDLILNSCNLGRLNDYALLLKNQLKEKNPLTSQQFQYIDHLLYLEINNLFDLQIIANQQMKKIEERYEIMSSSRQFLKKMIDNGMAK